MKYLDTLLVVVAGVVAVLCARSGLWIPALVFGILAVVSTILHLGSRIKMVLVTAFGLPLVLCVFSPIAGGVVVFLVVLAVLFAGRMQITVKTVTICLVYAAVAWLIMWISNVVISIVLILGILAVSAYCIFVRIHRMKKSLQVKVD